MAFPRSTVRAKLDGRNAFVMPRGVGGELRQLADAQARAWSTAATGWSAGEPTIFDGEPIVPVGEFSRIVTAVGDSCVVVDPDALMRAETVATGSIELADLPGSRVYGRVDDANDDARVNS